jgi:hypothetical protein
MGRTTPSMAKNQIKRSLRSIIDRYPTGGEVDMIWDYFDSSCAYCGIALLRKDRLGHCDHIEGASNNIYNFALACSTCNGDEKLDNPWLEFLQKKCPNESEFQKRRLKIESWMNRANSGTKIQFSTEVEAIIDDVILSYQTAVDKLRKLVANDNIFTN